MFIGRKQELKSLELLKSKKTASLVCIMGRRRIGKSSLIEEFGKTYKKFFEIQGLGPDKNPSNADQLEHFAQKISLFFNIRKEYFADWTEAFHSLIEKTKKDEVLILLDEISWMGKKDPLFAAKLKEAWDIGFKKNSKLMLVACGSVSSWIEDNILNNADFEGRVSLSILLQELSLNEINQFWKKAHSHMGSLEKMLILSVTGGVPKYLEEILQNQSAEQNVIRLAFNPNGLLFHEFEKIFSDIFERKSKNLEKIIRLCLDLKLTPQQLAQKLKVEQSKDITNAIHTLELSGFLSRDYYFKFDGTASKLSHLRVKDNYLRFYLKTIEPLKAKILRGGKIIESLFDLPQFESLLGYQFENLILANRTSLYSFLDLKPSQIISAAPYVQRKTSATKGACQIDLLIHSQMDVFYVCEFKCKKQIDKTIIKEMQKKLAVLKVPKRSSIKPILVFEGEIFPSHRTEIEKYFYKVIHFQSLLES